MMKIGSLEINVKYLTLTSFGLGIYLNTRKGTLTKIFARTIITGALATYQYKKDEEQPNLKQWGYGALEGLLTASLFKIAEAVGGRLGLSCRAEKLEIGNRISQMIGAVARGAISAAVSEIVKKWREVKFKELRHYAYSGGVGGFASAVASQIANRVMKFIPVTSHQIGGPIVTGLKKFVETGLSAGSSKVAATLCENAREKEEAKKKPLNAEEVGKTMLIWGLIGGVTAATKHWKLIHDFNRTHEQIKETKKEVKESTAEKAKSEHALQCIQKTLEESSEDLAKKQAAMQLQEQEIKEKLTAKADFLEAQERFLNCQEVVKAAQERVAVDKERYVLAQEMANSAEQQYTSFLTRINENIRRWLSSGFKAKIRGHYEDSLERIQEAYIEGKPIEWKKGQNRFTGSRQTIQINADLKGAIQRAWEAFNRTNLDIQQIKSHISSHEANLKIAMETLALEEERIGHHG